MTSKPDACFFLLAFFAAFFLSAFKPSPHYDFICQNTMSISILYKGKIITSKLEEPITKGETDKTMNLYNIDEPVQYRYRKNIN